MNDETCPPQSLPYFLGCPVWNWPTWRGTIYPQTVAQKRWLHYYSTKFNCVEGNSTFYGIPSVETAKRWATETVDGFRFALKFPGIVSHDKRLIDAEDELDLFFDVVNVLSEHNRLGPSFLQLPPSFGPRDFDPLVKFLGRLPRQFPYALELRHPDWSQPTWQQRLDDVLVQYAIDRVIFDSRPLFSVQPSDEYEVESQKRKPKVLIYKRVTGNYPLVRLIGCNNVELIDPWIEEWTDEVVHWLAAGKTPFVFAHAPNDEFAPQIAQKFHKRLQSKIPDLPDLPEWETPEPNQLELF